MESNEVDDPKSGYSAFTIEKFAETTIEEKLELIRKIGKQAKEEFSLKYQNINRWFKSDFDQLYLLSFCMRYFLMFETGYDEEAETGECHLPLTT